MVVCVIWKFFEMEMVVCVIWKFFEMVGKGGTYLYRNGRKG